MNPFVYHIVSGQVFFTGVLLIILAIAASTRPHPVYQRVTLLAFLLGVFAVVISSTPLPYWCYAIAIVATLAWLASRFQKQPHRWIGGLALLAWLLAAGVEIPYHMLPKLAPAPSRFIAIIGDSVTAGIGGDEAAETWPNILAREQTLQVQDISHVGETAASAFKRLKDQTITAPVVVVEIGGNDILGTTSSDQFAADLDALLSELAAPGRQIVMFELPLPPFYHLFGYAQRRLAAKYNVALVPKRVFLSIIAGSDSTLDSIHLSQAGHQTMATRVWQLIEPAFDNKPTY